MDGRGLLARSRNRAAEYMRPALRSFAAILALLALFYWAVRNAPLEDIWGALRSLRLWQFALLAAINALVVLFTAMRWWLIARAESPSLPLLPLIGYRLSAFALSYFTLGPQVGGEPLQIMYLRRRHQFSFARAASTVVIDKLLEFLGNVVLIGIGLLALLQMGIFDGHAGPVRASWLALAAIVSLPPVYLALLASNRRPIGAVLLFGFPVFARRKWLRLMIAAEYMAASFLRRHYGALLGASIASLLGWVGMTIEYLLMLRFLQIEIGLWQAFGALSASLMAFLIPLPGGLGALEASQVLVLGLLGYRPAQAIGLTLLMRARDLVNAGFGVMLAGKELAIGG